MKYFESAYDEWAAMDDTKDQLEHEQEALTDALTYVQGARREVVLRLLRDVNEELLVALREVERLEEAKNQEMQNEEDAMAAGYFSAVLPAAIRHGGRL